MSVPPLCSIDSIPNQVHPRQPPQHQNGIMPTQPINSQQLPIPNYNQNIPRLPPKAALKPSEKKQEQLFNFPIIYVLPSQAKYIHKLNENSNRTTKSKL